MRKKSGMKYTVIVFFVLGLHPCFAQIAGSNRQVVAPPDRREVSYNNSPAETRAIPTRYEIRSVNYGKESDRETSNATAKAAFQNQIGSRNDIVTAETNDVAIAATTTFPRHDINGGGMTPQHPAANHLISPGSGTVRARYSSKLGKHYYYCTSEYSRNQIEKKLPGRFSGAGGNVSAWYRPDGIYNFLACNDIQFTPNPYYWLQFLYHDALLISDETSKHSNSAQHFSFDGYIVYDHDTISGIVTITHNAVAVERPINRPNWDSRSAMLNDRKLSAIMVQKGPKTLHLIRLENNKHLSRLVHNGKLMVFDHSYSFITADNVSKHLTVVEKKQGLTSHIQSMEQLIDAVNRAYGLHLFPETISKRDLIAVVNRLD